jgi:hypothetical protein
MKTLREIAETALKNHGGDVRLAAPKFLAAVEKANLLPDLVKAYLFTVRQPGQGSIRVKKYEVQQYRRRTQEEKAAADEAARTSIEAVFGLRINGRAIGDIAMGELASLRRDLIQDAIQKLVLGVDQVRNAILAEKIEQHVVVPDQLTRVRDAIDAETLVRLLKEAESETPRRLKDAMDRAAEVMEHRTLQEIES